MTTTTNLLTVSLLVEQNPAEAARMPYALTTNEQIRKAVLAAVATVLSVAFGHGGDSS